MTIGVHNSSYKPIAPSDVLALRALASIGLPRDSASEIFVRGMLLRIAQGPQTISDKETLCLRELVVEHWRLLGPTLRTWRKPEHAPQAWALLEQWGLRTTGGRLLSARAGGGGDDGTDEALYAVDYVEDTDWFAQAKPAILHVFGHGQPPSTLRYREPGETLTRALSRLGWYEFSGSLPRQIPKLVVERFYHILAFRLAREPFRIPRHEVLEDYVAMGEAAGRELRGAKYRGWSR